MCFTDMKPEVVINRMIQVTGVPKETANIATITTES